MIFLALAAGYFSLGRAEPAEEIFWGVNFSPKQAEYLGLDWRETYSALIDELGPKKIKIMSHWDLVEPGQGEYDFENLDWQIEKAERSGAGILLVLGMKTGRWPECHIPKWAKNLDSAEQQEEMLKLIEKIVLRYKDRASVRAWQVENEPLFPFGQCPDWWPDKDFLKEEIALVKSLDPERPVIISDSGEFSFWIRAARLGDIVSPTLHRRVWSKELKAYVTHYWFRPVYYWRRAQIIKKFFDKEVIVGELQAEPWCPEGIRDCHWEEQAKTMDLQKFKDNLQFVRKTGLNQVYLWGAEYWYWLKEKQNRPELWREAQKLF